MRVDVDIVRFVFWGDNFMVDEEVDYDVVDIGFEVFF